MTYYAHSIFKYNTKVEEYELSLIPGDIINPNGIVDQTKTEDEIMKQCFGLIDTCDDLVFSSVDGMLGTGVVAEIQYAMALGKPVYYLHNHTLNRIKTIKFKLIKGSGSARIAATFDYEI